MKNRLTMLRNRSFILFAVIFLYSCSPTPEKTSPKVHTVEIRQMRFQPSDLRVKKGDTVIFTNKDIVVHDVTEEATKAWTSSALPPEKSYTIVVQQSANYYCTIHPVMKGGLIVE